jgi:HD-GYP domain-containing protein (c-di-GMP phosphodiesterase class II)
VADDESERASRWVGRPWAARSIRALVYLVPFTASVGAALLLGWTVPKAPSTVMAIVRFVAISVVSTVVLFVVDRVTRRLLPLAALFDLTLIFPDQAPSRYGIALRASSGTQLKKLLDEYRTTGAHEPARAAERLIELVAALRTHDRLTRGHSERVRAYSQMIGEEMGMSGTELDRLRWAGLVHDIGKLLIDPAILNKPGKLTDDEYEEIKRHPDLGATLAAPLAAWLGESVLAVSQHHERWDGKGYPRGLSGREISLPARIVSVADTFDVMTSARSYKAPRSAVVAREELARCAGSQFDPAVVRAFLNLALGRLRMAMGPLSCLTHAAVFPKSLLATAATPAASAMAALTGVAAASIGVAAASDLVDSHPVRPTDAAVVTTDVIPDDPGAPVQALAGGAGAASGGGAAVGLVDLSGSGPDGSSPSTSAAGSTTDAPAHAPTSTSSTLGAPIEATAGAATTTAPPRGAPASATTTTAPRSTTTVPRAATTTTAAALAPTTTGATTPATVPPTVPPTAATTVPPTVATTVPPTTVPAPTTTAAPPPIGGTWLLGSSAAGDVVSQPVLPLVARSPLNASLPNFDTDRDANAGLLIRKGGALAVGDPTRMQRFRLTLPTVSKIDADVSVRLYAAPAGLLLDAMTVNVALVHCTGQSLDNCAVLASGSTGFVGLLSQYQAVDIALGHVTATIAPPHVLELWVVADASSSRDLWLAYDTNSRSSALTFA